MAYLVRIGNRAGGGPTYDVNERLPKPTLECYCRSIPKFIGFIIESTCFVLTMVGCSPDIPLIHKKSMHDMPVHTQVDKTRTYIVNASFGLGMMLNFIIIAGYVVNGVQQMARNESVMLFLCGGLSLISGSLILDAVINYQLYECTDKQSIVVVGVLQVVVSIIFFLDFFVAFHTSVETTSTAIVQPQQGQAAVHLPAKV